MYSVARVSYPPKQLPKNTLLNTRYIGAFLTEPHACALAISRQIRKMESITGGTLDELRFIAQNTAGGSLKDRYNHVQDWIEDRDWFADSVVIKYEVEESGVLDEGDFVDYEELGESDDSDVEDGISSSTKNRLLRINQPPRCPVPASSKVYIVYSTVGYDPDGRHSSMPPENTYIGAYLSESHAYALAISRQIRELERYTGEKLNQLRSIAHDTAQRSLECRLYDVQSWIEEAGWIDDSSDVIV
ncbi:hypothetical protein HK104_001261, partial [Borealophlyctis nickersoniae]